MLFKINTDYYKFDMFGFTHTLKFDSQIGFHDMTG